MANEIGKGRVRVHMKITGLTPDDWAHIQKATGIVRLPDQSRTEIEINPEDIHADSEEVHFPIEVTTEGKYVAGCRLDFNDGYWVTSQTTHTFYVNDGM